MPKLTNNDDSFRAARREAVLRAARKVFEKKGLEGASIRLIAKAANCTTGAIYPYFKGKEEIYAEVLTRSLGEWELDLLSAVHAARTPDAKFRAALASHFNWYSERRNDLSLALYLFNGLKPQGLSRELDAQLNAQLRSLLAIYNRLIKSISGCSDREAEVEVGIHFAMLFGLLTLYHTKRTRVFNVDAQEILSQFSEESVQRLKRMSN